MIDFLMEKSSGSNCILRLAGVFGGSLTFRKMVAVARPNSVVAMLLDRMRGKDSFIQILCIQTSRNEKIIASRFRTIRVNTILAFFILASSSTRLFPVVSCLFLLRFWTSNLKPLTRKRQDKTKLISGTKSFTANTKAMNRPKLMSLLPIPIPWTQLEPSSRKYE